MQKLVDDFIKMNQAGQVLALCEKYYDDKVVMLNNGAIFAESMQQAYQKQKGFVSAITKFEVKLISSVIVGNVSELTFHYNMSGADSKVMDFTGKHVQTWHNNKIVREEYFTI